MKSSLTGANNNHDFKYMLVGEVYSANAEENPQVYSSARVIAGSIVCLIASVAAFWYSSMYASKAKKEVVHQDSKIRLLSAKEILDQSRIDTKNAPLELREHWQSPKVDMSKVASKLESPGMFESFI